MIERERLQELIEQKATIWHDDYGEIELNEECEICRVTPVIVDVVIGYVLCGKSGEYNYELDIDELEEDIKTAKWKYEMHTQRPEFFEPPIYEEWLKKEIFEFYSKDHKNYAISVCLEFDFFESPAKDYIEITNLNDFDHHKLFCAEKTKDNYIKACEYALNLFLGKENENE